MLDKLLDCIHVLEYFARSILVCAGVGALLATTLVCIFAIWIGPTPTISILA
jgi:hypothetical protein